MNDQNSTYFTNNTYSLENDDFVNELEFQKNGERTTLYGSNINEFDTAKHFLDHFTINKYQSSQKIKSYKLITNICRKFSFPNQVEKQAKHLVGQAMNKGWSGGEKGKIITTCCLYIIIRENQIPCLIHQLLQIIDCDLKTFHRQLFKVCNIVGIGIPKIDYLKFVDLIFSIHPKLKCDIVDNIEENEEFIKKKQMLQCSKQLVGILTTSWLNQGKEIFSSLIASIYLVTKTFGYETNIEELADIISYPLIRRIEYKIKTLKKLLFGLTKYIPWTDENFNLQDFEESLNFILTNIKFLHWFDKQKCKEKGIDGIFDRVSRRRRKDQNQTQSQSNEKNEITENQQITMNTKPTISKSNQKYLEFQKLSNPEIEQDSRKLEQQLAKEFDDETINCYLATEEQIRSRTLLQNLFFQNENKKKKKRKRKNTRKRKYFK
ncbi:transcription factor iiib 50 kda subunit [Anaeramoeba flamelloides]|uniref:Transcription factor iiib 50 kDa subunit n=1 Tax=Anaeramoeba flamelloides TaxID=1746091 RepID=A0ABQ8X441_9EUKA|nr:transcription factor iiib 50 kda subunit [Anaeramoeba flamelloides]